MKKIKSLIAYTLLATAFVACDDDSDPTASTAEFAATELAVDECDGVVTLGIMLNAPAAQDVAISFTYGGSATQGVDYTAPEGSITILKGNSTGTLPITLIGDLLTEGAETIEVSISSSLTTSASHVLTIEANKPYTQSNFTGTFDADEPGYAHYDVTVTADATDPNAIIVANFWDGGAALKAKYIFDNAGNVTIPTQDFVSGGVTYTLMANTEAGTYDPCSHTFIVPYIIKRKTTGALVDDNVHTFTQRH
jgi:hypothetical protein